MFALPKTETIELLEQRATALSTLIVEGAAALADGAQIVPEIFNSRASYAPAPSAGPDPPGVGAESSQEEACSPVRDSRADTPARAARI
jgi:hypothetical protein